MQTLQKLVYNLYYNMKKIVLVLLFLLHSTVSFSQEIFQIPKKTTQKGFVEIDFLSVKMPNDNSGNPESNMGLAGTH